MANMSTHLFIHGLFWHYFWVHMYLGHGRRCFQLVPLPFVKVRFWVLCYYTTNSIELLKHGEYHLIPCLEKFLRCANPYRTISNRHQKLFCTISKKFVSPTTRVQPPPLAPLPPTASNTLLTLSEPRDDGDQETRQDQLHTSDR